MEKGLNTFGSLCNKVATDNLINDFFVSGSAGGLGTLDLTSGIPRRCCMSIRSWVQASLLLLSIGLLVGVHAQSSTTGNITGTVRDPQGAAVPHADVTITEEKTGAS